MFDDKNLASLTAEQRRALLGKLLKEKAAQGQPPEPSSFPLSFAQQRLWFLDKLQPMGGTYNVCKAFWLGGDLNTAVLQQAMETVIGRHQSLRTTFDETKDGRPIQIISPNAELAFSAVDLRDEAADTESEAFERMEQAAVRPFDLNKGPLFRAYLWQTAANVHLFLVVMHHIISDAWSLSVFFKELSAVYGATLNGRSLVDGRSPTLSPLAIQYTDYAEQQRTRLQGRALEGHLAFWQEHLAGRSQLLELPTDRLRPSAQQFHGSEVQLSLTKDLSDGIKTLSRQQKTTPYTALLTAFNVLLARYTGQDDVIIGSPTANRHTADVQALIGFFVNVMPLRTDLSGDPTFIALLGRVRQRLIGTMGHQELPFERLVEAIQPERDLSRHPVFQVVFAMQNVPDDVLQLGDLTVWEQSVPVQSAKFDLTLFLKETAAGYGGSIEYSADLFERQTIERLAGHFEALVAGIVANPTARLSQLPLLGEGERGQLVEGWNETTVAFSTDKLVQQLVSEQAARWGEKTAVIHYKSAADVEATVTYGELNRRANQLTHYLRRLGVGAETAVGVCMSRSVEMVVALLGILKTGAAYLPLDPIYPQERLAFMLADAAQMAGTAEPILLTQPWLKSEMPDEGVRHVYLDASWETIESESSDEVAGWVTADNLAYLIYTSGTTGRPKGIQLTHRSLLNLITWHQRAFEVAADDKATLLAGPAFDAAVWELWPYLTAGATLHIPDEETRLLPWQMRDWLVEQGITISFQPTPLAEGLMGLDWPEAVSLRKLLTGGDKLTQFPPPHLPFELINNYGPTENTVVTTAEQTPPLERTESSGETADMPPIGRPISNVQLYITDKNLNLVPIGVPGELLIGGDSLARGYLNRADLTAAAFIPDPFSNKSGRRLYRTGDRVKYLADGRIAFLGRIDQQVKIRGFRIELGEIEAVLGQHSAVAEALVLAREDGPDERRLVGYVIPKEMPGSATNLVAIGREDGWLEARATAELRAFLGERLPDYMVPTFFVTLSEWPLTPNGKIDRRALPAPDWTAVQRERPFAGPTTAVEEKLAAIWQAVLGLEQVGIHDNFFELGGDSILSIQILARANQAGFQLTTRQLFKHQTIATLAANVGQAAKAEPIQAEQGLASGAAPLTPIQRWFFEQALVDQHHWNMALVLETRPNLDLAALRQTVEMLVGHHDALRLRYVFANGKWQQFYVNQNESGEDLVGYVELAGLSRTRRQAVFEREAAAAQSSLNLADGPLIRAVYFDAGPERDGRLLLVIHHLVVDGVSWRVLLADLEQVYRQLVMREAIDGPEIFMPPKTVSFQRWGQALESFAKLEAVTNTLAFWLERDWSAVRSLPRDFLGAGQNIVKTAETVTKRLTRQETQALLQKVPAAYNSQINDILLTALARTISDWSGAETVLVDLEGHGREPLGERMLDISRTVGWFTTMYPVLLMVGDGMETAAMVSSIQTQLTQIPGKGLSFGLLRYLGDEKTAERLRKLPQAELSFNYLGQYDNLLPADGPFQLSQEAGGPTRSLASERRHLLNVNGQVIDGRLEMSWTFSRSIHKHSTVERLAADYVGQLQRLIEERPINGVSWAIYERILAAMGGRQVEGIWSLGPGQAAMVAHSGQQPESEAYFLQWVYKIEGDLDTVAFRQAWALVIARHAALRTLFVTGADGAAYQVVLEDVSLDWQELDWRELEAGERERQLTAFLTDDRAAGFRSSEAPPIRWTIVQLREGESRLVWSHHHALLDGWSMAPLWREVLAAYEAIVRDETADLPKPIPFGRYLDWVRRQPIDAAQGYWQNHLEGIGTATNLVATGGQPDSGRLITERAARAPYRWIETQLSMEETAELEAFAKRNRLTLNTVVQGAWARVLAKRSGQKDVVFGVTGVGRPSGIPGVEQIVGLMLNTLPLRVQLKGDLDSEAGLVSWLREIQAEMAARSGFEHVSLGEVRQWLGMDGERPLFESFLRFQNYPMKQFLDSYQGSLTIRNSHLFDEWHHPMSVVVVPGERLVVRIGYDIELFDGVWVAEITAEFMGLLGSLATN